MASIIFRGFSQLRYLPWEIKTTFGDCWGGGGGLDIPLHDEPIQKIHLCVYKKKIGEGGGGEGFDQSAGKKQTLT